MAETATVSDELAVLRQYLSRTLSGPSLERLDQLIDQKMRLAARSAYFILDTGDRTSAETFISYTLSRLMRQLNHDTRQQSVLYHGRVRGRIVWPATFKAHFGRNYDPTSYVCREARRKYDTAENQLLKYLVERLDECLKSIPRVLRNGSCYFGVESSSRHTPTRSRLEKMEASIRGFRRNVYFQDIATPAFINESHLLHANTSRMEEYSDVASLYRRYVATVESTSWDEVVEIAKRVLPLPGAAGSEGDIWIELGAVISRARHDVNRT